jgi:hypothetical protein
MMHRIQRVVSRRSGKSTENGKEAENVPEMEMNMNPAFLEQLKEDYDYRMAERSFLRIDSRW